MLIGIDEAGRGALAGPVVVCAAAIINPKAIAHIKLADSKVLSPTRRKQIYEQLRSANKSGDIAYAAWLVWQEYIDKVNILNATKLGARSSLQTLINKHLDWDTYDVKIDGNVDLVAGIISKKPNNILKECIVKGDSKVPEIMLASIVAKCARDEYMEGLDSLYPGYDFAKSKGYPSPKHIAAIAELGPTDVHRKTFKRVKEYVQSN